MESLFGLDGRPWAEYVGLSKKKLLFQLWEKFRGGKN